MNQKLKSTLKNVGLAYVVLGSSYMLGTNETGHPSADLYLGISKPTKLEKMLYRPIFKKLGLEVDIFEEKK